jgi:hypothetical protein
VKFKLGRDLIRRRRLSLSPRKEFLYLFSDPTRIDWVRSGTTGEMPPDGFDASADGVGDELCLVLVIHGWEIEVRFACHTHLLSCADSQKREGGREGGDGIPGSKRALALILAKAASNALSSRALAAMVYGLAGVRLISALTQVYSILSRLLASLFPPFVSQSLC